MSQRIVVAMSGGVDSSVAAALLHEHGDEVIGVTLQLWGKDVCVSSGTRLCCSVRDAMDARAVAKRLGIRHEVLELVAPFQAHVIDYFLDSYAQGLTPNPCIACNNHIKFGSLMEQADRLGADYVATGHYAQSAYEARHERYTLRRARDPSKDQSYVLFGLTQAQLSRARFPIGSLTKADVRRIARSLDLVTADKPDSQDVCFVRDRNKDGFLRRALHVDEAPGPIVDTQGKALGTHKGLLGYTIGQREGLGISVGVPLYVVALDQAHNRLIVGTKNDVLARWCRVVQMNWVSIPPLATARRAQVKIRARHEAAAATLRPQADGAVSVEFDDPQAAITPGQAAVAYDGDLLLGGGWISSNEQSAISSQQSASTTAKA